MSRRLGILAGHWGGCWPPDQEPLRLHVEIENGMRDELDTIMINQILPIGMYPEKDVKDKNLNVGVEERRMKSRNAALSSEKRALTSVHWSAAGSWFEQHQVFFTTAAIPSLPRARSFRRK